MLALLNQFKPTLALLATLQFLTIANAGYISPDSPLSLNRRAGCSAFGPLTNSPWGFMDRACRPGQKWRCQVKDSTGCAPGDSSGVVSFTIVDSVNRQDLAGGANQIDITGECTDNAQIRCVLQLQDKSLGEKYTMTFLPD